MFLFRKREDKIAISLTLLVIFLFKNDAIKRKNKGINPSSMLVFIGKDNDNDNILYFQSIS